MPPFTRDTLDLDILVVGAGPAGLAFAIHLNDQIESARAKGELKGAARSSEFMLMVIEKSAEVGDHMLSGAVMDPRGLDELLPDWRGMNPPLGPEVSDDALYFLTANGRLKVPFLPPAMHNHGFPLVSLNQMVKWLGKIAEDRGIQIMTCTAGASPIIEEGRFKGVVTDDKGIDRNGQPKGNFEPGMELRAKITLLAEGPRGSLTKAVVPALGLDRDRNPQSYVTGVKEIWEIHTGRVKPGNVWHTLGYPHGLKGPFGGGWIYSFSDTELSLGLVTALNAHDPRNDPHGYFQQFKEHPWVRSLLKGGRMTAYGAKTISEGGYWAMPQLYHEGLLLAGESGGYLNALRLKGIHLAIKSGIMAAKTAFNALQREDYSEATLKAYDDHYRASWAHKELRGVRNFHQPYEKGLIWGMFNTGLQMVTGGRGLMNRYPATPDHLHYSKLTEEPDWRQPLERRFDGSLTYDKLSDVFASGTRHEENQPPHLRVSDTDICSGRCSAEYGNPCQHFCPAAVYEMLPGEDGGRRLQINASNCVHCKTCDIADPYGIITWVPPEGGGGPRYAGM
ncbi:MAG: electron transfer flavoprotein-ubiquinone oxidoreductase [Calditrichaeota bacterium]|nr:electron transfer flavoprotein-ubiquinone oxidoreductase [Calditrichota bacterium]